MSIDFANWFGSTFGYPVPEVLSEFLATHPKGAENGLGPRLWPADQVMAETEDRQLALRGMCLIGTSDSIAHILLRPNDGRVFIVDSHDYAMVDAWFADVQVLANLLNLQ